MKELDKFKGCLVGGAVGDALGYPIEFMRIKDIKKKYGDGGIEHYELNNNLALISDDTQMTLFTAEGILVGFTRGYMRGIMGKIEGYVYEAYISWLETQNIASKQKFHNSWLLNSNELNHRRAPGNTCLTSLMSGIQGSIEEPINNSKGCGSVMRVAPVGLYFPTDTGYSKPFDIGMKVGAITHGNPTAYLASGLLALIISKIVHEDSKDLGKIITEAVAILDSYQDGLELKTTMQKAIDLSHQDIDDIDAIQAIGEGWVAEEALAIAVYSALKHRDNFKKAIICSVNHSGDSDSTGSITGNIIGAFLGLDNIPEEYLKNLELVDIILEISEDLFVEVPVSEFGDNTSEESKKWIAKYIYGNYKINKA